MNSTKFNYDQQRQRIGNLVTGILNQFGESSAENLTQCIMNRSNQSMEYIHSTVRRSLRCGVRHGFLVKTNRNKYSLSFRNYQTDGDKEDEGWIEVPVRRKPSKSSSRPPVQHPRRPVQHPRRPVQQPRGPVQHPRGPEQPPRGPEQPPRGPVQHPRGPEQPPRGPEQPPRGPVQHPRGPEQHPRGPEQPPSGPVQPPREPSTEILDSVLETHFQRCIKKNDSQECQGLPRCFAKDLINHEQCKRVKKRVDQRYLPFCQFHLDVQVLFEYREAIVKYFNVGQFNNKVMENKEMRDHLGTIFGLTPEIKNDVEAEYVTFLTKYKEFIFQRINTNEVLIKTVLRSPLQMGPISKIVTCVGIDLNTGDLCLNDVETRTSDLKLHDLCIQHQYLVTLMKGFTRTLYDIEKFSDADRFSIFPKFITDALIEAIKEEKREDFGLYKDLKRRVNNSSYCSRHYASLIWRYELMRICSRSFNDEYVWVGRHFTNQMHQVAERYQKCNCYCLNWNDYLVMLGRDVKNE